MLLSILLVADEFNPGVASILEKRIRGQFDLIAGWENNYEVVTASLSEGELANATGHVSGVNALLVREGHLNRCSGKYVWVLPAFIAVGSNSAAFTSLLDTLTLGVDAAALYHASAHNLGSKVEFINSAIELLPISNHFEEFRYVLRRDAVAECFGEAADFHTSLTYLLFQESKGGRLKYAAIPCELNIVEGVTNHALFSLGLSFFSGTKSWHRETLVLPRGLAYKLQADVGARQPSKGELDALRHFLFSSCSALEFYSAALFNERADARKEALQFSAQVVAHLEHLCGSLKQTLELTPQIARLSSFLNHWEKIAAGEIVSENVANPNARRGMFEALWWLDRGLKDDFNRIGSDKFRGMLSSLRRLIEAVRFY